MKKEYEAGGQKVYRKTSITKQALCFDYSELMANYNINLNIDTGVSDVEVETDGVPSPYTF